MRAAKRPPARQAVPWHRTAAGAVATAMPPVHSFRPDHAVWPTQCAHKKTRSTRTIDNHDCTVSDWQGPPSPGPPDGPAARRQHDPLRPGGLPLRWRSVVSQRGQGIASTVRRRNDDRASCRCRTTLCATRSCITCHTARQGALYRRGLLRGGHDVQSTQCRDKSSFKTVVEWHESIFSPPVPLSRFLASFAARRRSNFSPPKNNNVIQFEDQKLLRRLPYKNTGCHAEPAEYITPRRSDCRPLIRRALHSLAATL